MTKFEISWFSRFLTYIILRRCQLRFPRDFVTFFSFLLGYTNLGATSLDSRKAIGDLPSFQLLQEESEEKKRLMGDLATPGRHYARTNCVSYSKYLNLTFIVKNRYYNPQFSASFLHPLIPFFKFESVTKIY